MPNRNEKINFVRFVYKLIKTIFIMAFCQLKLVGETEVCYWCGDLAEYRDIYADSLIWSCAGCLKVRRKRRRKIKCAVKNTRNAAFGNMTLA